MRFHLGRTAGLAALLSFATFLFALTLLAIGAGHHDIELRRLAPPLDRETLAAFYTLRAYYWPAVWLVVLSLALLMVLPIGLSRALDQSPTLATVAAALFYLGIILGFIHVGFQSLAQTAIAKRFALASPEAQPHYLALAVFCYDANDFFEKAWGIARSASMVLYTIALFRTGALGAWPRWISLIGALELVYRVPMIAFEMPSGGPQDIFMTVWQIGIGIALLRS